MSFLELLKTSRGELVYLVRAKNQGEECWYYILVEKQKLPMFKIRVKTPFIELSEYGEILASGWGANPPEGVEAEVRAQFS